jgi:hypothetical protein
LIKGQIFMFHSFMFLSVKFVVLPHITAVCHKECAGFSLTHGTSVSTIFAFLREDLGLIKKGASGAPKVLKRDQMARKLDTLQDEVVSLLSKIFIKRRVCNGNAHSINDTGMGVLTVT